MSHRPTIAFFGTPELAVYVLEELAAAGVLPDLCVTAPDKPVGRKLVLTPPAVKVWAQERDIPVLQPPSLRNRADVPELANSEWDLFIVAAYNIILPQWVLDLPKRRTLNVHPSLLPKLRGPSPIRSAILLDQKDAVGVTVIELDRQVDHGPIVAQAMVELDTWPVPGRVLDELLFREGGRMLAELLPAWLLGTLTTEPQIDAEATFSKKFIKEDGELHLTDDAYQNCLKYCAYDGWPGVFFYEIRDAGKNKEMVETVKSGNEKVRVKITEAEYVDGVFRVLKVVPEGKREMSWSDFSKSIHSTPQQNGGSER